MKAGGLFPCLDFIVFRVTEWPCQLPSPAADPCGVAEP